MVATPLGNLEDITLRALRTLREVDFIAAEDTRETRKILARHGMRARLVAFHAHSRPEVTARILAELAAGARAALVTDAGTPGISDPGADLVAAAVARGIGVVPVPGPSAVTTALSVSGFPAQQFAFHGFPPRAAGERRRWLAALRAEPRTLVFYEAPQRLVKTLEALGAEFGERPLLVARELTKQFEELVRGSAADALRRFQESPPRGECVVVVAPAPDERAAEPDAAGLAGRAAALLATGLSPRDAAHALAADAGISRRTAYAAVLAAAEGQRARSG